ncbi:hypothetical protein ACFLUU_06170 [Chloroflexota bacterium]
MPSIKKNKNENQAGNSEVTSLSFNRLGSILLEIAQNDPNADKFERDRCYQSQKQQSKLKPQKKKGGKI